MKRIWSLLPRAIRPRQYTFSSTQSLHPGARFLAIFRTCINAQGHGGRRIVGHWLVATSGLVFGIVVLGGLTRLTESGLSMVDWHLIHFRPPRTVEEWQQYFSKYQQYPEYQNQRRDMTLEEFKRIYWYEHAHRVYGRLLGLFVALPTAFFVARKWVSPRMRKVLLGCTALVGFQGLLGWYMVKSGLRQEIIEKGEVARVSQYRLAAHLTFAFTLYLVTLSAGLQILTGRVTSSTSSSTILLLRQWSRRLAGLTFGTAITGAFVAGLDAGMIYNSFPLMGGRLIPSDIWDKRLSWKNVTENPTTVQFIHRCMAITTLGGVTILWFGVKRSASLPISIKRAMNWVAIAAYGQATLGILTLLWNVPISLASAHQAGSLAFLTSYVWFLNRLRFVVL